MPVTMAQVRAALEPEHPDYEPDTGYKKAKESDLGMLVKGWG